MTSNTAPSGTASASSEYSTTYSAWKAMDRLDGSYWRSTSAGKLNCWLQYTFPSAKTITKYTITGSTVTTYSPKAWVFQGYNGATWDTLDNRSGITSWTSNEKKEYTFTNATAYTQYRIYITEQNGGTYTGLAEIEMMESVPQVTNVNVASINLQTEIVSSQAKISSLNLQTEVTTNLVLISSLNLQVEFDLPSSRLKHWNGSEWVAKPLKYYNGSAWVDKPLKFYKDGSWQ